MSKNASAFDLQRILSGAQLPALPQSAIRLLELSQDPDLGPAQFAVPIEADPGLTGQVLKFVNSSYFGFAREISTVKMAISLVGIRTIKNFALWSAVFSLMPNPKCGPLDLKSLWQDSLRRGLFARAVGKLLGMRDAEECFAAALLQDMAVPLLAKAAPEVYLKLLTARDQGKYRLSYLEQQVFGWSHAQAAGMMASHWNLPDEFVSLIETHTSLDQCLPTAAAQPGKVAVALAAMLPPVSDPLWLECGKFDSSYEVIRPEGGPAPADLLAHIDHEFAEFAPVLKMATPRKSLTEAYQESCVPAS